MKIKFVLIAFCFYSLNLIAQNDYSTITLFRPAKFKMSAVKTKININGTDVAYVKSGGKLEYKLFTTRQTTILVNGNTQGFGRSTRITLNTVKGRNYFIKITPKHQITSGYFELEQTSRIDTKKLKEKKFITASELDFEQNQVEYNHPKTEWTTSKLKTYWGENGTDDIEGIYEKVGNTLEYNLAVVKENQEYKIVYLSGANGTSWNEGDLKAELQKTAQFGLFKSNWFMLNKYLNKDILVTFDKATMKTISENGSGTDTYIKVYPTYEQTNEPLASEWKSSATGFFIDENGYIVTNYHVIDDGSTFEVDVTTNGETKSLSAKVVSVDKQNDLAILKIDSPNFKRLKNLQYSFNTKTQDVGTSVFALGFPLTQIMGKEIKFTDGKISSKSGYQGDITTYQITVPIQSGNSGGPLFDEKGNLVGITSSGLNKQIADNANYAIKTSYLKLLIDASNAKINLPQDNSISGKGLTDQIKILSEYVVMIKVK
jgi:S1-C subfamily serine protease